MAGKRIGRPPVADHGTRAMYCKGCRCEPCRLAEAAYKRQRRLDRPALTVLPTDCADGTVSSAPGPAAAAVDAVLAGLPAVEARPLLVEGVRTLARGLDDPGCAASHPSMLRELRATLEVLRSGARGRGRLSAVRALSARETAG